MQPRPLQPQSLPCLATSGRLGRGMFRIAEVLALGSLRVRIPPLVAMITCTLLSAAHIMSFCLHDNPGK